MPEATAQLRRCKPLEIIPELAPLKGARVVDVGCGDGALVRALTRLGAEVAGIEILDEALARARAAEPAGGERYLKGVGEDLPLPNESADLVIFMNSLHHVPIAHMGAALAEAARVLAPEGRVLVNEPVADGAYFELSRQVDDETEVRTAALAAIRGATALETDAELFYLNPVRHETYESFADRMAGVDPTRRILLRDRDTELRALFQKLGTWRDGAWWFDQPARINLLRKPSP